MNSLHLPQRASQSPVARCHLPSAVGTASQPARRKRIDRGAHCSYGCSTNTFGRGTDRAAVAGCAADEAASTSAPTAEVSPTVMGESTSAPVIFRQSAGRTSRRRLLLPSLAAPLFPLVLASTSIIGSDDPATIANSVLSAYGLPLLKASNGFKLFDDFDNDYFFEYPRSWVGRSFISLHISFSCRVLVFLIVSLVE